MQTEKLERQLVESKLQLASMTEHCNLAEDCLHQSIEYSEKIEEQLNELTKQLQESTEIIQELEAVTMRLRRLLRWMTDDYPWLLEEYPEIETMI